MNAWWLSYVVNNPFDDSVLLSRHRYYVYDCRKDKSFATAKQSLCRRHSICEECNIVYASDLHHLTPIWFFVLTEMCEKLLKTLPIGCISETHDSFVNIDYPRINSIDNLRFVCKKCHKILEKESFKTLQKSLHETYYPHLAFSYEQLKRQSKLCVRQDEP